MDYSVGVTIVRMFYVSDIYAKPDVVVVKSLINGDFVVRHGICSDF
jgi:hypothetical protein